GGGPGREGAAGRPRRRGRAGLRRRGEGVRRRRGAAAGAGGGAGRGARGGGAALPAQRAGRRQGPQGVRPAGRGRQGTVRGLAAETSLRQMIHHKGTKDTKGKTRKRRMSLMACSFGPLFLPILLLCLLALCPLCLCGESSA